MNPKPQGRKAVKAKYAHAQPEKQGFARRQAGGDPFLIVRK